MNAPGFPANWSDDGRQELEPLSVRPADRTEPPIAPNPLAAAPDPSLHPSAPNGAAPDAGAHGRAPVAWVRPSDLPATVGRELMGRVVDLQAAFAHAAWRSPVTVTRAARGALAARQVPAPDSGLDAAPPAAPVTKVPPVSFGFDEPDLPLSEPGVEGIQLS